jgi:RNase H-fold protein (predicted Holliday junction resolvase)
LPIAFIDENLTSRAAQDEMGRVRVADIKRDLDSAAARVILENAIAMINRLK